MRIAIDAHSVGTHLGGNETYAINLIEALAEIDQKNQYTLYVTRQEGLDRFANRWPNFVVHRTRPHTPLVRIPLTLSRELRRHPVDVLHVQYTAPPFAPCPIVTTIHDLAFEHLPETFNRRSWMQLRLTVRSTARRAAQIITVSEYSRQDIIETYGTNPKMVTVTPEAASPNIRPVTDANELRQMREIYGIPDEYILSLCSIQPRKNLVRLIEAYSLLRRSHPEGKLPELVLAGKRGWLDKETMRAAQRDEVSKSIRFTGYVADEHLNALYSAATCFVYPSYFEGFGLPILEAMKCGTPVITGNRTSIPEVAGQAALLFDPFDVNSLVEALKRMLNDSEYRATLSAKGLHRANEFSWQTTARLTLAVYEKAAGQTRVNQ